MGRPCPGLPNQLAQPARRGQRGAHSGGRDGSGPMSGDPMSSLPPPLHGNIVSRDHRVTTTADMLLISDLLFSFKTNT